MSIFQEYYSKQTFNDRFLIDAADAIDVIIPVYHTNELWETNLISLYREIPIRRLLISDGGVVDNSIEIVKKFPRVEVFNHRYYKTLGKCVAELIKEVSSEWFIYVHSDVYLPDKWYEKMIAHKDKFDWYGCPMNSTILINYRNDEPGRPYFGSQIGRKEAFIKGLDNIDDDFVYRQEDFVFDNIVNMAGYKCGKVEDTFHYHQLMYRKSTGYDLNVVRVRVETNTTQEEISRTNEMQIRGIVKYLDPVEPYVISNFKWLATSMLNAEIISYSSFRKWIKLYNPKWLAYFNFSFLLKTYYHSAKSFLKNAIKKVLFLNFI